MSAASKARVRSGEEQARGPLQCKWTHDEIPVRTEDSPKLVTLKNVQLDDIQLHLTRVLLIAAGAADFGSWWTAFHLNIKGEEADNKRWSGYPFFLFWKEKILLVWLLFSFFFSLSV